MPRVLFFLSLLEKEAVVGKRWLYLGEEAVGLLLRLAADLSDWFFLMLCLSEWIDSPEVLQGFPKVLAPFGEVVLKTAIIISQTQLVDPFSTVLLQEGVDVNAGLVEMLVLGIAQSENRKVDDLPVNIAHGVQLLLAAQDLQETDSILGWIAFACVRQQK